MSEATVPNSRATLMKSAPEPSRRYVVDMRGCITIGKLTIDLISHLSASVIWL